MRPGRFDWARGDDVVVAPVSVVGDDVLDVVGVACDGVVQVAGDAELVEAPAIGVRGRLPRVLGEHDGADVEFARAEDVDESQHVLVVRDAEVAAHLGLLDVVGVDGDDDLHVVGEAFGHAEFGIRLEAGQHA